MPRAEDARAFEALRPKLTRIAYRMLGSHAEAEDIVQDAWLRWARADRDEVSNPAAFLSRTVTRLCLDQLKSARAKRETYVGFWLPEPLIEYAPDSAGEAQDVTMTLMLALERLSPLERAAFLLHDVFDTPFAEVAAAIGRDEAACRQLAARARAHVRSQRPRYPLKGAEGEDIARAFFDAVARNDAARLKALLADNVVAYADGGGKAPAHLRPIHGRDKVLRLIAGLAAKPGDPPRWLRAAVIDSLPGFIAFDRWGILHATALAVEGGKVSAFYSMRNPDKLGRVSALVGEGARPRLAAH